MWKCIKHLACDTRVNENERNSKLTKGTDTIIARDEYMYSVCKFAALENKTNQVKQ